VLAAADSLDALEQAGLTGATEFDVASHEAALQTSKAKVVVHELVLRAGSQLFDVGGASATRQNHNLDRHWRNARTLASHNPTPYKARAIGDHVINGTPLPMTGFF
jgi:alkylation response protein AidB-like acyl-CoA dehydrogenase